MRIKLGLTISGVVLSACITHLKETFEPVPEMELYTEDWRLVWQDEFEDSLLDTAKWSADTGDGCPLLCGWGNNELQYYTSRPQNLRVENGKLIIQAHKEEYADSHYTSAKVHTRNKADWKYGKVVVSAKIPEGGDSSGCWPAIWMMPTYSVFGGWPRSGEIDIMEAWGPNMDSVSGAIHWYEPGSTPEGKSSVYSEWRVSRSGSFSDNFHEFSITWTPQELYVGLDGQNYMMYLNKGYSETYPFSDYFYLILNIAIGGRPFDELRDGFHLTEFPQTMEIDYVRVYSRQ